MLWAQKSADGGDFQAQYGLASIYAQGLHQQTKDVKKAKKFFLQESGKSKINYICNIKNILKQPK